MCGRYEILNGERIFVRFGVANATSTTQASEIFANLDVHDVRPTQQVPVLRGFREWVLTHGWDANNTPMKAEQAIPSGSIEPGNAAMGPGSRQDFRFKSLGWTTKTGVYEIAVGQDIVALEAHLAASLAHVSALEAQVQQLQNQPAPPPPDPKAVEALAAMMELAKALKLVEKVAA
jgi:hypothetical protein